MLRSTQESRPRRVFAVVTMLAIVFSLTALTPTAEAHGDRDNLWYSARTTSGKIHLQINDLEKDGHCAVARVHTGGRWRDAVTDCDHGRFSVAATTWRFRSGQRVSLSFCLKGHAGSRYCRYATLQVL